MSFNLASAVEARLTPDVIGKMANATGETPARTKAAASAGLLAMIAAVAHRGSTREGASSLLTSLRGAPSAEALGGVSAHTEQSLTSGATLAKGMLGFHADRVAEVASSAGGVSKSSGWRMVAMLAPMVASVLGREATTRRLDAGGLSSMLLEEKRSLLGRSDLPSGLSGIFAAEDVSRRDVSITDAPRLARTVALDGHGRHVPWGLLIGALALAGILFLAIALGRSGRHRVAVQAPERPTVTAPEIAPPTFTPHPVAPPEPTSETTTTGAEAPKAAEDALASHFNGTTTPDRFPLADVNFPFASATPTDAASSEVDRLAALMKDHPNARLRLEGHTDSVGSPTVNRGLSYERAGAIKKMLVDRGIEPNRIETAGKLDADPIATNDTDEGRADNRRVEAVLLSR